MAGHAQGKVDRTLSAPTFSLGTPMVTDREGRSALAAGVAAQQAWQERSQPEASRMPE